MSTRAPNYEAEERAAMQEAPEPQREATPPPEPTPEPAPTETPEETARRVAEWAATKPPASAAAPPTSIGLDPSVADWALGLQPTSAAEAYRMAAAFHRSGLYEKKFKSTDQIWTVMLLGREHGLSVLAALQSMNIIDGKVEMDAALIVAKILRSGLAKYFTLIESTETHATWETHRVGEKDPFRMSFSVKDAERREIFRTEKDGRRVTQWGKPSNWQKMPDVMCMWRAATKLARAKYSDVVKGLYGQGEIREGIPVDDDILDAAAAKVGVPVPPANGARA